MRLLEIEIPIEEGKRRIKEREAELVDLRNEAQELHSRMDLAGVLTEQIADFASFYRKIGREDRRRILHLAIEKISVGETKYTIKWKFAHKPTVVSRRNEEKRSGIEQTLATEILERSRSEKGNKTLTHALRTSRSKSCNVVEIGANRQSCDPSTMLLFKLILDAVMSVVGAKHRP